MSQEIEASRETDALIAERVFGYVRGNEARGDYGWWVPSPSSPRGKRITPVLPPYSTDRSAALEVVDRLTEAGIDVNLQIHAGDRYVRVGVSLPVRTGTVATSAYAPTLPLAIARVSLDRAVLDYLKSRAPLEQP